MNFLKVSQTNVFELPGHARLLRIDFSISKDDPGALKVHFSAISENLKLELKPFENDDFAPSNSKFSLLLLYFYFLFLHFLCYFASSDSPPAQRSDS